MIFWMAVAGAAIIVILLVLRPLIKGSAEAPGEHTPEVDIYKDQLAEVEQDITRSLKAADRAYVMLEGKVVLEGKPADLTEERVKNAYFGI